MSKNQLSIERRVHEAAEAVFAKKQIVSPLDILVHGGFVTEKQVGEWRHGRVPYLERVTNAGLGTLSTAMATFRKWAIKKGLRPSITAYHGRGKYKSPLQFSKSGDPKVERCYSTHYLETPLKKERTLKSKPGILIEAADARN